MARWLLIAFAAFVLSACYPEGDCDVLWKMTEDGAVGKVMWDCDVEE